MSHPDKPQDGEKIVGQEKNQENISSAPENVLLDQILERIGIKKLSLNDDQKKVLIEAVRSPDGGAQLENNEQVVGAVVEQLKKWGFTPQDVHEKSLVLDSQTRVLTAEANKLLTSGKYPTGKYPSNVGLYSSEIQYDEAAGELVHTQGAKPAFFNLIENVTRGGSDNGIGTFSGLFRSNPRAKGNLDTIANNIKVLGLESHFSVVRKGEKVIEIREKAEDLGEGVFLDDVLRLAADNPYLQQFDPKEGIALAAKLAKDLHGRSSGGIGELLANDVLLQVENGRFKGARLGLPDMRYSEKVDKLEQQARDVLDLCFSVGTAGYQTGGAKRMAEYIDDVIVNYGDVDVIKEVVRLSSLNIPSNSLPVRYGFDRVKDPDKVHDEIHEAIQKLGEAFTNPDKKHLY